MSSQRRSFKADQVKPALPDRERHGQLIFDLGHVPSHAETDFIVGSSNELAFEHLIAFPHWPGPLTLVTGPAKSGKSHLGRIWVARAGAIIASPGQLGALARQGGTRPVLLEDVDRVVHDEQELFHFLNQCMRDGRPLLLTARTPVGEWPYRTDDVLSRARLASSFPVDAPDDIQLSQMFVKLFGDRQISVDPKIVAYLVARMERSAEEVVRLVALMDDLALTRRRPVTRNVAADALRMRADALEDARGEEQDDE